MIWYRRIIYFQFPVMFEPAVEKWRPRNRAVNTHALWSCLPDGLHWRLSALGCMQMMPATVSQCSKPSAEFSRTSQQF